jgi:hypothetical protein
LSRNLDKNVFIVNEAYIRRGLPVEKKTQLTVAFITVLLLSAVAGILIQNGARTFIVQGDTISNGNTIIDGNANANVTIQSPINKVYKENNITVAFTIETDIQSVEHFTGTLFDLYFRYGCVLDYDIAKIVDTYTNPNWNPSKPSLVPDVVLSYLGNRYVGNATLTGLSQGPHNLTVLVRAEQFWLSYSGYMWAVFSTVSFTVDSIPPNISILSPESKAFNTSDVPLDFTVNEAFSQISYSLDGNENVTASGNMTLTRLSGGAHNVTVYATDEAGNIGASETIYFNVELPEPFPTTMVIAALVIVAVIGVGLIVYFKKRKR